MLYKYRIDDIIVRAMKSDLNGTESTFRGLKSQKVHNKSERAVT